MVAGLKFLSKKSFNPQNLTNQKSVWEAEQESKREEARLRERERQLTIERDHEYLARSRDGQSGGHKAALRFMYDAPPGLDKNKKDDHDHGYGADGDSDGKVKASVSMAKEGGMISFERNSGDDDAAAAFRRMLAGVSSQNTQNEKDADPSNTEGDAPSSSLIISGSTAEANTAITDKSQLTQLEKAVGKKNNLSTLTYEEQIARFPQLKNAPVALKRNRDSGEEIVQTNLNFKPLGAQIRNVRCLACKVWGHSKGDRECKLSGWDPFASTCIGTVSRNSAKPHSIMPDKKQEQDEKYGYYGPGPSKHKRGDEKMNSDGNYNRSDSDSEDSSRRERRRRRKKKSKRHKESRRGRDRSERKRRRRKHRSYERDRDPERDRDRDREYRRDDDGHSYDSYSSDESDRRRRRRERKRKSHKRSRRSHSRRRSRSRSLSPFE